MNVETIIRAAENDGLRLALTDIGTVKCIGTKQMTERWAPQLRQHKAEIMAALTAANDAALMTEEADDFWERLGDHIKEVDGLIHQLCDLRGDDGARRADLVATRKKTAPQTLSGDIEYLKAEIATLTLGAQTRGRCIECQHFARVGIGERCAHPARSPPGEPPRADCLPAHHCDQFIQWRAYLPTHTQLT